MKKIILLFLLLPAMVHAQSKTGSNASFARPATVTTHNYSVNPSGSVRQTYTSPNYSQQNYQRTEPGYHMQSYPAQQYNQTYTPQQKMQTSTYTGVNPNPNAQVYAGCCCLLKSANGHRDRYIWCRKGSQQCTKWGGTVTSEYNCNSVYNY